MSLSVLQAKNVVAGYVPNMPILHGVSIHVGPSEIISIIGPMVLESQLLLRQSQALFW